MIISFGRQSHLEAGAGSGATGQKQSSYLSRGHCQGYLVLTAKLGQDHVDQVSSDRLQLTLVTMKVQSLGKFRKQALVAGSNNLAPFHSMALPLTP